MQIRRLPQQPTFVVRGDPYRPTHARQWFELPGREDSGAEVWCYTDRLSYVAGDRIAVHAISTEPAIDLELWTDGINPILLHTRSGIPVSWSETPETASVTGCAWPAIAEIPVPDDWPSSVCRLVLVANGIRQSEHLVVIRSARPEPGRLVLITADGTWNAYNDWGGSNHYEGIVDRQSARFSPRLSTQRPFARGMVDLPTGAPRTLATPTSATDKIVSYPHMEWAWENGYSKKYASAGWAMYERPFVHWAEAQGYRLDFVTQRDLHCRPELLAPYACAVCVGHDEYWSWEMRDAIDAYLDAGGRVARFAGNFMWQIRLEDEGRTQICHKYLARSDDPLFGTDRQHLTTNSWEAAEIDRPGRATFGLDATCGMYAGFGGLAAKGSGGFTLYRDDHWAFDGCRLGYGDILGFKSKIFGYEVDGLNYRIENGLPYPEPQPHLPEGLEILALGLARLRESDFTADGQSLFVGDEDAKFVADLLYGQTDEETLSKVNRGSGMIVCFRRGLGEVFHAGTTEWVAGLIYRDEAVERVTRNVLDRFLKTGSHV